MIYPSVYQLGCAVQAQLGQHNAAAMRLPTLQKTDGGPTLHPLSVFGTRAQCEAAAGYDLKETLIWAGLPTSNVRRFAREMSAKKRASDAKWTITLAGVVWLVAKTTTAPQFQFVHDQTLQMARLDGEAPDNASDDMGGAALPRGPRTGLADMTRPAQRRREVWKALHRLIAPDGSRQAMVDGLAQLFESDEGMLARVVAGSSHALRDHLHQEFTAGAAMARETINADELGVCCRWPWDDVESINVVKDGTTLWLAARRSPVVSRQYREETRKLGEEPVTKLLWSTAASPDPTPNNVATSRRAWKLTASTNRGFNAVYDWLERYSLTAPPTRISFTAGAATAETSSAAPAPAAAAADAAPKPSQPEVAPCLAYPDQCRDALLSLERLRVKYQRHMPADVFDASAYERFQTALVGDLKKLVFVDFTASIRDQPMFRAAAPPPAPPSSDDDDAPLTDLL